MYNRRKSSEEDVIKKTVVIHSPIHYISAHIARGNSESGVIDFSADVRQIMAFQIPQEFDGDELHLMASIDGTHFSDLYDEEGSEIMFDVEPGRYIITSLLGIIHLKVYSGQAGQPINQQEDREILIAFDGG